MFHWEKKWFCIAFGLICCDELTNPDYCSVHSLGLNPLLNFQKRGGLGRISVLRECQQIIFVTLSGILATMREGERERERERGRESESEKDRDRERQTVRESEGERQRHRDTDTDRGWEVVVFPWKITWNLKYLMTKKVISLS